MVGLSIYGRILPARPLDDPRLASARVPG